VSPEEYSRLAGEEKFESMEEHDEDMEDANKEH
jgi:hypothetical protein